MATHLTRGIINPVDPCFPGCPPYGLLLCVAVAEVVAQESHGFFQVGLTLYQMTLKPLPHNKLRVRTDYFEQFSWTRTYSTTKTGMSDGPGCSSVVHERGDRIGNHLNGHGRKDHAGHTGKKNHSCRSHHLHNETAEPKRHQ